MANDEHSDHVAQALTTTGTTSRSEWRSMDTGLRLDRLRRLLHRDQLDALVVTNLTNVRYLTGFTGSAGVLVVTDAAAVLVTDGRYADQAPAQVQQAGAPVEVRVSGTEQDKIVVATIGASERVGLEAATISWSAQLRYAALLDSSLTASVDLVEQLRVVKDEGEIDRMAAAAAIADSALAEVRHLLDERVTEVEFGLALDTAIRRLGASGNSFETIVASGENSALPHARPSDRRIAPGDLVVLDFGAVVDGYCSDMTRTVIVGEPSAEQLSMVDAVAAAQEAGVQAVAAGVRASDVDRVCRDVLIERGLGQYFTHSTGHGVGLDIHEAPRVSALSDATLASGFVVTVEPGVYRSPFGGVRIEDTVVVTEAGCVRLTTSPKTLSIR